MASVTSADSLMMWHIFRIAVLTRRARYGGRSFSVSFITCSKQVKFISIQFCAVMMPWATSFASLPLMRSRLIRKGESGCPKGSSVTSRKAVMSASVMLLRICSTSGGRSLNRSSESSMLSLLWFMAVLYRGLGVVSIGKITFPADRGECQCSRCGQGGRNAAQSRRSHDGWRGGSCSDPAWWRHSPASPHAPRYRQSPDGR
jgi:hypothetical protein